MPWTVRLCSAAASREGQLRASDMLVAGHGNPTCGLCSVQCLDHDRGSL